MDKTTRNNFSREAIKLAEQALITYFVDGSTEKVLQFFSNTCSSWIGWGKEEIYPTYNDVFNTFIRRVDDIPENIIEDMHSQVLFESQDFCIVFVACSIKSQPQTGILLNETVRFTFVIRKENDGLKIVHLHSSAAWNELNPGEVYPVAKGGTEFYKNELQMEKPGTPSFVAANTPNGLKCCLAQKNYPAVYINKALYKLAGYKSMTEMLIATGGDIKNMIYAADLPKVKRIMAAHCGEVSYTINYRLLRKDGTAIWVLERGQFTATDGPDDYFICSIAPLLPDQNEFNYGTLLDYSEIENAQIPMDLYFKTALKIIEKHDEKTAAVKLLKLCCSMAQISGAFIKDISRSGEYMPVVAKYFNGSDGFVNILKCTPEDIARRFNSHGLNQCGNTGILPKVYKDKLDELGVKAYLSKTIMCGDKAGYVLTFVSLGMPHSWTESEKDLITQTARLLSLLFKTNNQATN